jgi:hypothetical protein
LKQETCLFVLASHKGEEVQREKTCMAWGENRQHLTLCRWRKL